MTFYDLSRLISDSLRLSMLMLMFRGRAAVQVAVWLPHIPLDRDVTARSREAECGR